MVRGPNGEKRPGGTVENAIHVAKIATGEIEDNLPSNRRNGGLKGGPARAKALTDSERGAVAKKAARRRWASDSAVC